MRFLLDANAVIAILRGGPAVLARLKQHRPSDLGMPSIVAHELCFGALKSQRQAEHLARLESLQFEILEFDREDARRAGQLRAHLALAGTPIGPYDVLIAGQTLARNLTLITHNVREFRRVPELVFEDWEGG